MKKILRLGARGSPLALTQAHMVKNSLLASPQNADAGLEIELVTIQTSGDWKPEHKDKSFIELGGNKGLFTKEIEEALLDNRIDLAVHSMKDVASVLPDQLEIAAILQREDVRDAFIGRDAQSLNDLPQGAHVGTSSLRRKSQILAIRPDLRVTPLRGNVETRLKKISDGVADATLLAMAGLKRLGLEDRVTSPIDIDTILPAAAQGAIGIEIRSNDEDTRKLLAPLNCPETFACVSTERALLKILDGNCHTPIGVYAEITDGHMTIRAAAGRADGTHMIRMRETVPVADAAKCASRMAYQLKEQLPPDFFAA